MAKKKRAVADFMTEEGRQFGEMLAAKTYARLGVDIPFTAASQVQTIAIGEIVDRECKFRAEGISEAEVKIWAAAANMAMKQWLKRGIENAVT